MTTWHRQPTGDGNTQDEGSVTDQITWVAAEFLTTKEALEDPDFPIVRNALHPDYGVASLLRCRRVRIDATGFRVMTVTAEFGIPTNGSYEDEPSLIKPLVYSWQTVQESPPIDRDKDGNAILTSAGRSVSGITKMLTAKRLTITRWESTYNATTALTWENSVNSGSFEGAAEQEVKLETIQPSTSYDEFAQLLPVDYVFLFKPAFIWLAFPHQVWIKDIDSKAWATADGKTARRRLCDPDGNLLTDVPLDGTGRPKDPTKVTFINKFGRPEPSPVWAAQATPPGATIVAAGLINFLRYNTLPDKDFSELGL